MSLTTKQKNYIKKNSTSKSANRIAKDLKANPELVQAYLDELKTSSSPKKKSDEISTSMKRLFLALTLSIPVLFFVFLEIGLQLGDYRGNLDLFLKPEVFDGEIVIPNSEFTKRYFFNVNSAPNPSSDTFLATKPENGFRVFAMGGSTANGYPYGYNASFSRVFRDILSDAAPNSYIEVINVATSAINTYTLFDQIDEILEYEPDAILIYSGHNEYYGALGVGSSETFGAFPGFVRTYLKLQRLKTFLLIRDIVVRGSSWFSGLFGSPASDATGTLMQRMVGNQQITLESDTYELGKLQFQSNLNAIIQAFEKADIPVFIGSLASNMKDQPPFISIETENHPAAETVFDMATKSYATQEFDEAREQFIYAKNLDALRFRAPTEFNIIIREISDRSPLVHYVPVKEAFMNASEHQIIGHNLMLEHLHPNYTGYHLMGLTFFDSFQKAELPGLELNPSLVASPEHYLQKTEMTEYDKRVGDHRIKLLVNGWPFTNSPDPEGYPKNYTPYNIADSVAYSMVNMSIRWDLAKVRLAEIYEAKGDYEKALAEYRGLIREQPYNDSPFLRSAKIHIEYGEFRDAKPFLEEALAIEFSVFAAKMLGAIEVDAGNIDRGIELLEKVREIEPEDPQTLFNLSGAYGLKNQFDKADEILTILEKVNPTFPGAQSWRVQLDAHLARSRK